MDQLESAHQIRAEEIEFKHRQRVEAEKAQIEKEYSNLIKLAEAKNKDVEEEQPLDLKITAEEIEQIRQKHRALVSKEFKLKLDKEIKVLQKEAEGRESEKLKLEKLYEK